MSIRTAMLGTAALLTLASGARAADAVVMAPAPEPMEYVRVCDVYGAGFFYIPGTETCLKISGYVFYEIGATSDDGNAGTTANYHGYPADEYNKYIRARVNFDARSETEWGTLRAYIRMQTDYTNGDPGYNGLGNDPDLGLDQAWLSLGGFRAGYADSAWKETVNGGDSGLGTHSWYSLEYGGIQRQLVQYNFGSAKSGFFGTLSLEHDPSGAAPTTANYIPDVVGKIGFGRDWGVAWATVGVDETSADTGMKGSTAGSLAMGDTEFAVSAGLHLNIPGMTGDSLRVIGYYSSDPNAYWNYGDWGVLGSYYHQFTPTFGASVGGEYIANTNYYVAGDPNLWLAELNLVWTPVTDFEIRSEITYAKETDLDGSVSGFLRFTRFFGG